MSELHVEGLLLNDGYHSQNMNNTKANHIDFNAFGRRI